jgi:hypothetical protein
LESEIDVVPIVGGPNVISDDEEISSDDPGAEPGALDPGAKPGVLDPGAELALLANTDAVLDEDVSLSLGPASDEVEVIPPPLTEPRGEPRPVLAEDKKLMVTGKRVESALLRGVAVIPALPEATIGSAVADIVFGARKDDESIVPAAEPTADDPVLSLTEDSQLAVVDGSTN